MRVRVAASPDTVKRLVGMGLEVVVEAGAGAGASYIDAAYSAAGAGIAADAAAAMGTADIILKVQRPIIEDGGVSELAHMRSGTVLIGMLQPLQHPDEVAAYAKAGLIAFAMELIPRITRAQSMDVLSSQANLAGYRAVLDAATEFGRAFPMMMTAAGTIAPARVLVMGAGVAGLQAIATARRLGGVVSATDVRAVAKEQVESLGASFLTVDLEAMKAAETAGGYAKEMSEDFQRRQREHVHEALKKTDIVICTALIPGRKAPVLVTKEMVADMRPGSVIVDLAVEQGGNCEGSKLGKVVTTANGVRIVGHANVPSRIAVDASALYARNLVNFLGLIIDKDKALKIDAADEIIKGTLLTQGGAVVHPALAEKKLQRRPPEHPVKQEETEAMDSPASLADRAGELAGNARGLAQNLDQLAQQIGHMSAGAAHGNSPFVFELTVFVLACFVGYYVVWRVTPALHSPLMSVTNAVSSVIIVGALIAAGPAGFPFHKLMGFIAVILASVNIFGGFIVTQRMLQMFKKKPVK